MEQTFYVLKEEGEFYPMAFVSPADEAGKYRKEAYKLKDGQEIVEVKFIEQMRGDKESTREVKTN